MDGEWWERKSNKKNVRVMCVGVVLHVYKPAAYLALLSPAQKSEERTADKCAYVHLVSVLQHHLSYEALAISFSF